MPNYRKMYPVLACYREVKGITQEELADKSEIANSPSLSCSN